MAGGFITLPQAIMSVVGGVPVQPAGAMTVIEKLRAAKSMIPGDIGGILGKVLSDGPGAILQNPIQGVLGTMGGQLNGITSALGGMGGASGLLSAIGGSNGLQGALSSLGGVSASLSGIASPLSGGFGLIDAIGHANITQMLGANLPAGLSLQTAMAPILMGSSLNSMSSQLSSIASSVTNGSVDMGSAASSILGMASQINGVINNSTNAFSAVQSQAVSIAQTTAAISMLSNNVGGMADIATMIIQAQHLPAIQKAITDQLS